jgi:hypothetical protein
VITSTICTLWSPPRRFHVTSLHVVYLHLAFPFFFFIIFKSRDSSVGIELGYGQDNRGLRFDSRRGLEIFLFTTASRTALGHTQPSIQGKPGALSLGVKRPGREVDHSPPSGAEVKNAWSYTSTPQYVFMAWWSVKYRNNFTVLYIHDHVQEKLHKLFSFQRYTQNAQKYVWENYIF